MNVVARARSQLNALINKIASVFHVALSSSSSSSPSITQRKGGDVCTGGSMYMLKASDETVNVTLIVIKGSDLRGSASSSTTTVFEAVSSSTKQALKVKREATLESWLKVSLLSIIFLYCVVFRVLFLLLLEVVAEEEDSMYVLFGGDENIDS